MLNITIEVSFCDKASLLDFDVFATISVHLDVSGLESTPTIYRIESLMHQISAQLHLTHLLRSLLCRHSLLEPVVLFAQLGSLPDPTRQHLLPDTLLHNLLSLNTILNLLLFLLYISLNLLDVMQLFSQLFLFHMALCLV